MTLMDILVAITLAINIALLVLLFTGNWAKSIQDFVTRTMTSLEKSQEHLQETLRDELSMARQESNLTGKHSRRDLDAQIRSLSEQLTSLVKTYFESLGCGRKGFRHYRNPPKENRSRSEKILDSSIRQVAELPQVNSTKLEQIRSTVEQQVASLQQDNPAQWEKMRRTLGEIQLDSILEQVLTHDHMTRKPLLSARTPNAQASPFGYPGKTSRAGRSSCQSPST